MFQGGFTVCPYFATPKWLLPLFVQTEKGCTKKDNFNSNVLPVAEIMFIHSARHPIKIFMHFHQTTKALKLLSFAHTTVGKLRSEQEKCTSPETMTE